MLSPAGWKHVSLRTSWALLLWKSFGVGRKKNVQSLIYPDKEKDLVVQQNPQLKDESEVPRVGEELLVLPVAIDGG